VLYTGPGLAGAIIVGDIIAPGTIIAGIAVGTADAGDVGGILEPIVGKGEV
jgi:hypothetical protein